jgi:hypothetical protein
MSSYALNSPVNRKVYVPGEDEIQFAPVEQPKPSQEQDQTHRNMQWLFHKPQNHAVLPVQSPAVKIEKKK